MLLLTLAISQLLGLGQLHEAGYQGEGVTIAVIDAGFYRANDATIFPQEQIAEVYDLLEGDKERVIQTGIFDDPTEVHGSMCLSTMLYCAPDSSFVGTAPKAKYILIRSEDSPAEYRGEVDRLIRALDLADSLNADIITVSLGYYEFDDTSTNFVYQTDANGQSAVSQKATEMARKGRLVCMAAGNTGNQSWRQLTLPGDADSILTVGAANISGNDTIAAAFSAYGPTADGRVKPEVSAPGYQTVVYNTASKNDDGSEGELQRRNGTSFATPEIAGMAASLWSALPHLSAMELRQLIIESGSLYPNPDLQLGYGLPDAWKIYCQQMGTTLENRDREESQTKKSLSNGRLIIEREGVKYDILGRKVE